MNHPTHGMTDVLHLHRVMAHCAEGWPASWLRASRCEWRGCTRAGALLCFTRHGTGCAAQALTRWMAASYRLGSRVEGILFNRLSIVMMELGPRVPQASHVQNG